MSFDAHSLERLRQLGRSLPKALPVPEPPAARSPRADQPRHRLETETNPETLFAELMQASADGTVPPHLLDRLRSLEAARLKRQPAPAAHRLALRPWRRRIGVRRAPAKAAARDWDAPTPASSASIRSSTRPSSNSCSKTTNPCLEHQAPPALWQGSSQSPGLARLNPALFHRAQCLGDRGARWRSSRCPDAIRGHRSHAEGVVHADVRQGQRGDAHPLRPGARRPDHHAATAALQRSS